MIKTKLNVCQFYIGVCCFDRNFIFMYIFFFLIKYKIKNEILKSWGKKEEIHTGMNR